MLREHGENINRFDHRSASTNIIFFTSDLMINEAEKVFAEALEALEVAIRDKRYAGSKNHHIFLKIIPEVVFQPEKVPDLLRDLGSRYGRRLWKLKVCQLEVAARLRDINSKSQVRCDSVSANIVVTGVLIETIFSGNHSSEVHYCEPFRLFLPRLCLHRIS